MIDSSPDPVHRIHRPDLLPELLRWAAAECALGEMIQYHVSAMGYDDCNVVLDTAGGRYVVKIFNHLRSDAMSARYVDVIERVIAAGVHHPRLVPAQGQSMLLHGESGNRLIVMEFIAGATFLDLEQYPTRDEIVFILDQINRIHGLDCNPAFVHDWWAVPNIAKLAAEVSPLLAPDDRAYVDAATRVFGEMDIAALPHALVHGDLTKANVMRCDRTVVAILDFAVANRYPRIHELAMVIVNLMHGDPLPIPGRIKLIEELYGQHVSLAPCEREALPKYVLATAAMELLGATREWSLKGNRSAETKYLLELGRGAVRAAAH